MVLLSVGADRVREPVPAVVDSNQAATEWAPDLDPDRSDRKASLVEFQACFQNVAK